MNEICNVYHEAEATREAGGHTISVDEMTGIQALEHKYPDKPVIQGRSARLLKRKSYKSIDELKASILRFIEQYNLTSKPFKWTYKGIPLVV